MDEITNQTPLILFDHGKKLSLEEGCLSTLDESLLSQDFLKPVEPSHTNTSEGDATGPFDSSLLILNNDDLTVERPMSLDDVVEFDLASLAETLTPQENPQEQLAFNAYLSGAQKFSLNGISSEKIAEVPEKASLSFEDFEVLSGNRSSTPCSRNRGIASGSNTFKILPTFADGKLTNTLHIPDSGEELANGITIKILPTIPELPTIDVGAASVSDTGKINTFVDNFSQIALNHVLDGATNDEPNLSDLIKVHAKNVSTAESNGTGGQTDPSKSKLKKVKKKTQPQKAKNKTKAKIGDSAGQITPTGAPVEKRKAKKRKLVSPSDGATPVRRTDAKIAAIPKINIVTKPDGLSTATSLDLNPSSKAVNSSTVALSVGKPEDLDGRQVAAAPSMPILSIQPGFIPSGEQEVNLILPMSKKDQDRPRVQFKPISELEPEDVITVQKNPLKKLSKIQVQQIINLVKQRHSEQNSPSSIGVGEKSKIICKVIYPEEFLNDMGSTELQMKTKDGERQKPDQKAQVPPQKTKGRTKKDEKAADCSDEEYPTEYAPLTASVTRSGRMSRPPKKMAKVKTQKKPDQVPINSDTTPAASETTNVGNPPAQTEPEKPQPQILGGLETVEQKKKPQPMHVCPGCSKNYIVKRGLLEHLAKFPAHAEVEFTTRIHTELGQAKPIDKNKRRCKCKCKNPNHCRVIINSFSQMAKSISDDELVKTCVPRLVKTMSVWDFLLHKVKALHKYELMVKGYIGELGKLFDSVLATSSKILYPTDRSTETTIEIEDNKMCHVLGVSKGLYQTYPDGLDNSRSSPPPVIHNNSDADLFFGKESNLPSELDIGGHPDSKEDLSQSSVLSEFLCDKSGMDTVDQLVQERLKTLAPQSDESSLLMPDDLTSLLETVNSQDHPLGDSASMFNLRSGSTEDFLKVLDTLSGGIQPNPPDPTPSDLTSHPEPPLDFTALSRTFTDDS